MNGYLVQFHKPLALRHTLLNKTALRFSIFDKQISSLIVA